MGTRSRIAARNAEGTFTSIYVHWDGYPSHHGPILLGYYNSEEKVRELLALGDMSSLNWDIKACREGAYASRGDTGVEAQSSPDIEQLCNLTQETGGEWLYVWTGHGWQCAEGGIALFGMPADKAPSGLESLDYWIQREARESAKGMRLPGGSRQAGA